MRNGLIGLDFGSESARGVLIDVDSGVVAAHHIHPYRHGVITGRLPAGTPLPPLFALQDAADYLEAAEDILSALGRGRPIAGIGIDFTASSPLPVQADGTPLSRRHPAAPHAYVKLWKHGAAQPWADALSARGGAYLDPFGGTLSGNSLTAKAAEFAAEAPELWAETARFIEAGDWLVWQLTGVEARSFSFASFKAQYSVQAGYPEGLVTGLAGKLAVPLPVGHPAGTLQPSWRARTGIDGDAVVAVGIIDGHVIVPAVGAVQPGTLVGALGTSACFLLLDNEDRPLPAGIEGVARDGTLPGLRCLEAGQAAFGDTLAWFARTFPCGAGVEESLERYTDAARGIAPADMHLVALDWLNGCRIPHADLTLSGLLIGLTLRTSAAEIFRALLESVCFGTRNIAASFAASGAPISRVVMTSGLSLRNPVLMQMMADILGRAIDVPQQPHLTAIGAAIHGAVASGTVADFTEGAARFGARAWRTYEPEAAHAAPYATRYALYRSIGTENANRGAMHVLSGRQG